MLNTKLLGSVSSPPAEYVDDVFSTFLYTGDGTTSRTITNGIDLAGEGGLVWIKNRSTTDNHGLLDTARGVINGISSVTTGAQNDFAGLSAISSTGFTTSALDSGYYGQNKSGDNICSWTFRKAPKFFDVVTFTGNGVDGRAISHSLGSVPGMIIVKGTSLTTNWNVYHRSLGNTQRVLLNATSAAAATTLWNDTTPTSTNFTVDALLNESGQTYVAYLFAHDAGGFGEAGADNVISCGSYSGTGTSGLEVNLGYEPQFLLVKRSTGVDNWLMTDVMRGITTGTGVLNPNLGDAESQGYFEPTSTGFKINASGTPMNASGNTYIYIAIRRPMKPPTSGTQVFSPTVYTGDNTDNRLVFTNLLTDMVMLRQRDTTSIAGMVLGSRLQSDPFFFTGSTDAQNTDGYVLRTPTAGRGDSFSAMNGVGVASSTVGRVNRDTTSNNHISYAFRRATGFFDVVCYTGTGSARTVAHNLGVAPELMIVKRRNTTGLWAVQSSTLGNTKYLQLNTTDAEATSTTLWNSTSPTSSVFTVNTSSAVNASASTYVAYLFASVAGVSKVGSYTGNGSSQTINCGFTAGARFVMVKATSTTGDWVVVDTARGLVSGNDPFLELNTTAAEQTGQDILDPDSSGFVVNQTTESINASGVNYIFLAIA